jgi:hypothetical protein
VYISLDQFKVIDTRRVKVPTRNGKSVFNQTNKSEVPNEHSVQHVSSPSPSNTICSTPPQTFVSQLPISKPSIPSTNNSQTPTVPPDYRFLLAWSYYLASQATWLSPMLQQQQGQLPPSLPTDPEAAAKFLQQAMQTAMEPLMTGQTSNNKNKDAEQTENELESGRLLVVKDEANDS